MYLFTKSVHKKSISLKPKLSIKYQLLTGQKPRIMINLDRIEKKCIAPGAPNCLSDANLISIVMTFIRREKKCPKKVQDDARWTEGPHRALE